MKIKEVIVVEGKMDLAFLKSFLDADIITTNGSEISQETLELIKKANEERGIIILTDPDFPGMQIRNKISDYIGECKHAFVEKEKSIKHHKVGVAEANKEDILEALKNVVTFANESKGNITYQDLIDLGLTGKKDSKNKRIIIQKRYHIGWCNAKTFINRLNMLNVTKEELRKVVNDENCQ